MDLSTASNMSSAYFEDAGFGPACDFFASMESRSALMPPRRQGGGSERRRRGIRTGCLSCRAKGVPCDRTNQSCTRRVSTKWKADLEDDISSDPPTPSNTSLIMTKDAIQAASSLSMDQLSFTSPTVRWHERHSFHFFINYTAPQVAGPFGSIFWQQMVIQAAYKERAILHALVALGSLHEGIINCGSQTDLERHPRYHFALRHVNNALKSMRTDSTENSRQPQMRLILTLCILLTTFEAFQGRSADALVHTMQGLKLFDTSRKSLKGRTTSKAIDDKPFPVTSNAITTVMSYYAYFSTTMTGQLAPVFLEAKPEIPKHFYSIAEASTLLEDVKNTITQMYLLVCRHPDPDTRLVYEKELRDYQVWLRAWYSVFEAYCVREGSRFSITETRQALILKANYLYSLSSTSLEYRGMSIKTTQERYAKVEPLISEMVDICEEVAQIESPPMRPIAITEKNTYFTYGMWLSEPLYVASTFASNPDTRQRAAHILVRYTRAEALGHHGPFVRGDHFADARQKSHTTVYHSPMGSSDGSPERNSNRSITATENNASPDGTEGYS